MTAIAIDDEPPALIILSALCAATPTIQLVQTFTQPLAALQYLNETKVDVLFVDINMPEINGFELVQHLAHCPVIVFTTAYTQYAVKAFAVEAIDYLLKPISQTRFDQTVQKISKHLAQQATNEATYILVKNNYTLIKVLLSEIVYMESIEDYIKIILENKVPLTIRSTTKAMLNNLPSNKFMRIHRSYIIALDKVTELTNKQVTLGTTTLPISSSYEAAVVAYFKTK